ncbi:MAG: aminoacyl-tRNA hydrolase [Bacteroidetes bacterium]|nr:aminoacyl-tRNA hydrolase [Bacteroidota bacterium]
MKYLIVGLGNIGDEYANTRHNIGFIILDALAKSFDVKFTLERHAFQSEAKFKGRTLIMIKPTTYMNLSGKALKYWMQKENIPIENVLIVVDDIALPTGALRLKSKGHDGGHNGLIHIIETLNSIEFPRFRIGIGNDFAKGFQVNYVLGKWTKEEESIFIERIDIAVEMIKSFTAIGIDRTMNLFNNK